VLVASSKRVSLVLIEALWRVRTNKALNKRNSSTSRVFEVYMHCSSLAPVYYMCLSRAHLSVCPARLLQLTALVYYVLLFV
jgi:hypothetical protein